jgi:hypothetical protein
VENQLQERQQQEEVAIAPPNTMLLARRDWVRIINKIKQPANWLTCWDKRDIENKRRPQVVA